MDGRTDGPTKRVIKTCARDLKQTIDAEMAAKKYGEICSESVFVRRKNKQKKYTLDGHLEWGRDILMKNNRRKGGRFFL